MARLTLPLLVCCLIVVAAALAGAQVPDPTLSTVALDPIDRVVPGLMACPEGDAPPLKYLKVIVRDSNGDPIPGVSSTNFSFSALGGDLSFFAQEGVLETDQHGVINFRVLGNESIPFLDPDDGEPYFVLIDVHVLGVGVGQVGLRCNTPDYDLDGDVDPLDFARFAGVFGIYDGDSDFNWSGPGPLQVINPLDFALFAAHFGHGWR